LVRGNEKPDSRPDVSGSAPECWHFEGGFTLDLASRTLSDASGNEVPLWRSEFALLTTLLRAPGRALSREQLLDAVSGRRAEPFDRSIDVLVGRLRRKIEPSPKAPRLIRTVPGIGYKFVGRQMPPPSTIKAEPETPALTERSTERRYLTVLHCAISSAGALAASLDPEVWREIVTEFRACCSETVEKFSGAVVRSTDGDLLAWFGYPEASEFDAERAVRTGLALTAAMSKLRDGINPPLRARVGIASGLVVVGDLTTKGQPAAALGEPSNLAAALLSRAPADAVLIAASTRRLVRGLFEQHALGPILVEDFARPIDAWQVSGVSATASRFLALRAPELSPLVGRDEDLELLSRRWSRAEKGRGQMVLVGGEPGIGKSRLLRAFEQRLSEAAVTIVRHFCSPDRTDSAFLPIIQQLERDAGFSRADSANQRLAKLEALLATAKASEEQVCLIAALLAIRTDGRSAIHELSPQQRRGKTLAALVGHLSRLAAHQPVLVLYEDIHWIDPSSLELLSRTVECIQHRPVLVLATARPEFRPSWAEEAHVTTLMLGRLDRHYAAALVAGVAAGGTLSDEVVEKILTRSEGVPLFVEELTKSVLEADAGGGVPAFKERPRVPASLHSSLTARLDRLGPAREVARIGAVIGREFDYELLRSVARITEGDLVSALEQLSASGLVFQRGDLPEARFLFKHALVQDTAYGSLLRANRRDLHRRIGEALEAHFPEIIETRPELLAHHFTEADVPERAIRYWLKAGQQALGLSGMIEAVALLGKGLSLASAVPDSQEHELDLQIGLGQAMIATQGYAAPAVSQAFARARGLCEEAGCEHKLLPILYGQWANYSVADLIRAHKLATEIQCFSEMQEDNVVAQVMSCRASGLTHLMLGDFAVARAYLERGLSLYERSQQSLYASIYATTDPLIFFQSYLSVALVCCGYLDQARLLYNSALAYARRLSHAHSLGFALHWTWVTSRYAGSEPIALLSQADELIALSDERSFAMWRALGLAFRGWCLAALDQPDEGIPLMSAGLVEVRATGPLHVPHVLTLCADAHRMAGQPHAALALAIEAEQFAEATHCKWLQAETLRLRGDLMLLVENPARAEASWLDAIMLAQRQGAGLFQLHASTSLAHLLRNQKRHEEASKFLTPISAGSRRRSRRRTSRF
jgi:class 3 adenylate cyclase/ABC-type transport system involved in cytochrome c biogenesis ATPase subunit